MFAPARLILGATVDMPVAVAVVAGLISILTAIGGAWVVVRQSAIKTSLSTIIEANAELRRANDDLRRELAEEKVRRGEIEGKLSVFVDEFASRIVEAVVQAWQRTHPESLGQHREGPRQ